MAAIAHGHAHGHAHEVGGDANQIPHKGKAAHNVQAAWGGTASVVWVMRNSETDSR